jgi:hypothetical protein
MREFLFVASNVGIMLGYIFMAAFVVPRVTARLRRTRIGGVGFFLTCGLHHLENVGHVLFEGEQRVRDVMLSTHMLLIDVPQVVFVWVFVTGLYLEVVRWGPWRATHAGEER